MTEPVASLPMYDWPELRGATDALWAALRDAMRARGLAAPERLARDAAHWTDPDLALSQTCGLPYRERLHAQVTLIGAPDYGLDGCPAGFYRSALVVRAEDRGRNPREFAGARFAFNDRDSQSGWAALETALGPRSERGGLRTGAHRASVQAVAAGAADIAAVDAVSWRLAQAWEQAAARLRTIGWTRPAPGLPMITARGCDPEVYGAAVAAGIAAADPAARAALGLCGFRPFAPDAYLAAA